MMLMPRLINGLLKSITFSRAAIMVSGAIARSASCIARNNPIISLWAIAGVSLVLSKDLVSVLSNFEAKDSVFI